MHYYKNKIKIKKKQTPECTQIRKTTENTDQIIIMYSDIIKFIRGIYKTDESIPLHEPRFIGNEKKYLDECIDSTFVSSVGKFVNQFEQKIAEYTGATYAIVCVNGTAALHMALLLCGVKQDDEVITQPLTFVATANAIAYTGANPIFIDVDLATLGLSPDCVLQFLEEFGDLRNDGFCYNKLTGKRIAACVPMHTFGHPVKIEKLVTVCSKYNIPVIEDAAESLGSKYQGKHTGTFGEIGILSFNGNKIITTGGGGMILTNNEDLAEKVKHLTTQAKIAHPWNFVHDQIGYNYRMPNINAALGIAQLENLDMFVTKKRELADLYKSFFATQGINFFTEPVDCTSNYWLNLILLENKTERDNFLEMSNEQKVMTRPSWQLMNRLEMFKHCQVAQIKNAEWIEERLVNLPSSVVPSFI
jgi:perosamine synthetase